VVKHLSGILVAHILVHAIHGASHVQLDVFLSPLSTVYVVNWLAPIVAGMLLWPGNARNGTSLLALSLFGSFIFATYQHFITISPDNVGHLPAGSWQPVFQFTPALVSVIDGAGAAIAWRAIRP
jgi:hypothetical protein